MFSVISVAKVLASRMRIICLDVGSKTIGVAVSDELGITAQGVTTIERKELRSDLDKLEEIINTYKPSEIVVGIPYNLDGSMGERAKQITGFAQRIRNRFSLPVVFWDERFSTFGAERVLLEADLSRKRRKKVIDKVAAVFILQGYLEKKRREDKV